MTYCPECREPEEHCWCWLTDTKADMQRVQDETIEFMRQKYPKAVKKPETSHWENHEIDEMTMEEYARHRESLLREVRRMSPEERRTSSVIPKPESPPKFEFKSF